MTIQMAVRPLGVWPGGARTPADQRRTPPFYQQTRQVAGPMSRRVPVAQTLRELKGELEAIACTRAVIEAGFRDWDIGRDGWPLARARTPEDPGVVLRLLDSKHGELTYPCDTFDTWEGNIRAIMLALEALRKVDRYGVTRRGEQYTGWKSLPSRGTDTLTAEAAAQILVARANGHLDSKLAAGVVKRALESSDVAGDMVRRARKATHPDVGGSTEAFQDVERAASVLAAHFGVEKL